MADLQSMDTEALRAYFLNELRDDPYIKVAALDNDGLLRGKTFSQKRFFSIISKENDQFGMCSAIYGLDSHDHVYEDQPLTELFNQGFPDSHAVIDFKSFRRIPWEYSESENIEDLINDKPPVKKNMPLFLAKMLHPKTREPMVPDPRTLIDTIAKRIATSTAFTCSNSSVVAPYAGIEIEILHYLETHKSLVSKNFVNLEPLTHGKHAFSLTRMGLNLDYQRELLKAAKKLRVGIEAWHTESGPGVYEAALGYCDARELSDNMAMFKLAAKTVGAQYGIIPCFMAKPDQKHAGNSGHMHISLMEVITNSSDGSKSLHNLFGRSERDTLAAWPDIEYLSDTGRHFLAGILAGLPWVTPLLLPTINSYKRLVAEFWAPVSVSWGWQSRSASIRLVIDPEAPQSTRFEVRTPGADVVPHLALSALFALGLYGIEQKLELTIPPIKDNDHTPFEMLPRTLHSATERFEAKNSLARVVLGDEFVDHYAKTRWNECKLWDDAVTNWEIERYMEII
ncbi:uncharacterized protein SAPINGB_P001322 [Magnusiomyces paraingens]|uniref:GS catalytic domain-containing protein n=1 Tax=Magnusiomyces paraingens TaxID=2606893 RepID=A0A5E8B5P1_9ASCO|nr:uncharacterized protein SAPINGB_P001322 [Saprochaete ingens]VVT46657.1 unnamed protein product [Saprochaete ingens]